MVKIETHLDFAAHLIELIISKKVETKLIFDHKNVNNKKQKFIEFIGHSSQEQDIKYA